MLLFCWWWLSVLLGYLCFFACWLLTGTGTCRGLDEHDRGALEKGGWAELGKQCLILAHHVSPGHCLLVVPVVLYHASTMAQPIDRPPLPLPWEQHPPKLCPAATSSPPGRGGRPGPACVGQNGQPKWRPESFFLFLRCEVEIP